MIISAIKNALPKSFIRNLRLQLKDMKRVLRGEKKLSSIYPVEYFSKGKANTFFGYYDITPFNDKNELVYVELEDGASHVNIVLNTPEGENKQYLSKSNAWNWQQGSRLRWFAGSNDTISFNDFDGQNYYNRIVDIISKEERRIDWPLYDIDNKGKVGLSLNFERLGYLRPGYGYTCRPYHCNSDDLTKEGISLIDIVSNKKTGEILYPEIHAACGSQTDLKDCYINHLSFSPSGEKFLFFWIEIINGYHKASLVVYDMNSRKIIPLELEMKASHYVWQDNDHIICTSYDNNRACRYYMYTISAQSRELICKGSLQRDGHPSFLEHPSSIMTDTYPDKDYFQHIYFVDIEKDKKKEIIKIYSDPRIKGERRTDLHPRFNKAKNMICFDANPSGHRRLYIVKIG